MEAYVLTVVQTTARVCVVSPELAWVVLKNHSGMQGRVANAHLTNQVEVCVDPKDPCGENHSVVILLLQGHDGACADPDIRPVKLDWPMKGCAISSCSSTIYLCGILQHIVWVLLKAYGCV